MIANTVIISDELLADCPFISSRLMRIMWYSHWREMRIRKNYDKLMALKAQGVPVFKERKRKYRSDSSEEDYEGL